MNISANAELMQKQQVVEHPQRDHSTGFDYRVHIKDAKTGRLIRVQDYAKHFRGDEVLLERPVGSGNMFHENGEPAGRYDLATWKKISDQHAVIEEPQTQEDLLAENAALQAELAELRAEQAKVAQAAPKK